MFRQAGAPSSHVETGRVHTLGPLPSEKGAGAPGACR